ncbi:MULTISPECIES: serine hydrolase [unclassified Bradyrhizobium]|uniref:serine hydrolase n=1 Tax=unclassified Bradyrhizobium TaxID=2631580 RepID=UPI001BAD3EEB|nr:MULTISPECIES: serine hydrolase [unclassified Bradyrhizobium]MBR1230375.1 serine hydrolase [Bradyrhizobium sp. AUGA SZCCT0176]MBR1302261.1 serine hydrolase [Bradyrhizobium sp. AUGA SZCCT0042]
MSHASAEAPTTPVSSFVSDLDRLAAEVMADWKVPGVALAVVQDGKVALTRAYGQRDVEANLPVTPATQFVICSITKSFTATAIALLHQEGRLDWTKPVRDYMPEFRLSDPVATERVTVRDLLSHQSGLPRHDWVHMAGDRAPAEMLGLMRHLELSRDIRTTWQYNNLCYNVAGLLIERLSGQSFEAFIRTRLTDRLGMTVSFNLDDLDAAGEAARPYMMHEDTRLPAMRLPIRTIAAGAINTSVTGLANWMRLHLDKGELDGERLLPAALIGELHASRAFISAPNLAEFGQALYGLGFQTNYYRGDRMVFHGGGWVGWGSLMTLMPDLGIGIAVLTNRSPSEVPSTLTWYILDRLRGRAPVEWRARFLKQRDEFIAHMQVDKDAREKARHKDTQPAHELAAYAGEYAHPAYGVMSMTAKDGALHWAWRGMSAPLTHRHYETFELPEEPHRLQPDRLAITFLTDRDGNIVSLSAPLEPVVKDIVFARLAAGDCTDPAFRARCVGHFKSGSITHRVTLDSENRLVLKPDYQPAYRLAPEQGRRFRIVELEGLVVEFRGEAVIDEVVFHQPNGVFVAQRVEE